MTTKTLEERNRICNIIINEIKIQREMMVRHPEHKQSIEWRIVGMELILEQIMEREE